MFPKPIKGLVKAVVSPLLDSTGLYASRIHRASAAPGAWTIVMYHRVIDDPAMDPFQLGMCVMRDRFERQIRYLSQQFQIITVADGMRRLHEGQRLPERALSITFDDGYLDNLTRALPVMQRYGVPFSLYVPTGGLEEGRMLWWDRVISMLAATTRPELNLMDVGLTRQPEVVTLKGVLASAGAERILDLLWSLQPDACERAMSALESALAPMRKLTLDAWRLSPQQVRDMRREGVEIGAHSVSHPNLELADEDVTRREMAESRRSLEDLLQEPVTGFAYPGGRMHRIAQRMAREVGFSYAVSTISGVNTPEYEPTRLRRIGMPDAELPDFRRAFSAALMRGLSANNLRF